jgi:peptidoglycan LD-endopeptidase CwlK
MSLKFKLSPRSLRMLEGVDERLIDVVHIAIERTNVDFGVIDGVRTIAAQKKLVKAGASLTLNSLHITGKAVDLLAYVGNRGSWELNLYDDIAEAMQEGALEVGVPIRWGAAWNVPDIRRWHGTMEQAMNHYIDTRRIQGKRPFIDAPHFEISE